MQYEQEYLRNLILASFVASKLKNKRFSQRAMARDLNLSPGELCSFLIGDRSFSKAKAADVLSRLKVSAKDREEALLKFKADLISKTEGRIEPIESSELLSDWNNLTAFSDIMKDSNIPDIGWISKILNEIEGTRPRTP